MLSEWNIEKHSAYWMHKHKRCVHRETKKGRKKKTKKKKIHEEDVKP